MTGIPAWTILPIGAWESFAAEWDALNLRLSASPLLCSRFVGNCLAHFSVGGEQLAVCRTADGTAVAAAIGRSQGAGRWSVLQISQAPLGFWLSEPGDSMASLTEGLARALGRTVVLLSVPQLDSAINPVPAHSSRLRIDPYILTARVTIDQDWTTYWNDRGKNLRNNHRKVWKRAADSNLELRLEASFTPDAVANAVRVYGHLEEQSWKAAGGTAVTPTNRQGRFYAALLSELASVGQARAYTLLVGGEPAAVDLCVTSPDCLVILKTTYGLGFKDLSPASLLRELYMQEVFNEQGVKRIEYYGRVMDWHLRWTSDTRTIYNITSYRYLLKLAHDAVRFASGVRRSEKPPS